MNNDQSLAYLAEKKFAYTWLLVLSPFPFAASCVFVVVGRAVIRSDFVPIKVYQWFICLSVSTGSSKLLLPARRLRLRLNPSSAYQSVTDDDHL